MDPDASQENLKRPEKAPKRHPKRHPKVVQNLVKKWSKSEPKNEQKKGEGYLKKVALTVPFGCVFVAMGPSKNAYFKTLSRCLKTVPKWFKNGSRLPKLFKIVTKIRPYKDL